MKTFIATLLITCISAAAHAQLFYAQGGVNFANITATNDGHTEKNNNLTSFNVGFMGRFGLSKPVDLEAGLLLSGKGSKAESYFNGGNDYVKSKFNPLYLELPLNLILSFPLQKTESFFVNAGPYIAVGVGGRSKNTTKIGPFISESESDIKFSNDDPFTSQQDDAAYNKIKRFDYGFNLGGGFALRSIILKVNYGIGLAKINSTQSNNSANDKNKYRTVSVSIGIPLSN